MSLDIHDQLLGQLEQGKPIIIGMYNLQVRLTCNRPSSKHLVKLRSHRANGRVTDKKLFYPFVSVRIRSLSVSHPVTPFLARWYPVVSVPSVRKF